MIYLHHWAINLVQILPNTSPFGSSSATHQHQPTSISRPPHLGPREHVGNLCCHGPWWHHSRLRCGATGRAPNISIWGGHQIILLKKKTSNLSRLARPVSPSLWQKPPPRSSRSCWHHCPWSWISSKGGWGVFFGVTWDHLYQNASSSRVQNEEFRRHGENAGLVVGTRWNRQIMFSARQS